MIVCPGCGLPLYPQTAVCPRCGVQVRSAQPESSTLSVLALVFAFVMPFVGLVLSIVGMVQAREAKNKKRATVALFCSILAPIAYAILYAVLAFGLVLLIGLLAA